mmetsp:Transcript_131824/g.381266  ORF Transcript_131824/g.381266 Transcript_131824/m.381266 type:complete len:209 (+) Transcript_131824:934-1560(+)
MAISWMANLTRARSSARNRPVMCCSRTTSSVEASMSSFSCASSMISPTTASTMCKVFMGRWRSFRGLKLNSIGASGFSSKILLRSLNRIPSKAHQNSSSSLPSSSLEALPLAASAAVFASLGALSSAIASPPFGVTWAIAYSKTSHSRNCGGAIRNTILSAEGVSVSLLPTCKQQAVLACRPRSRTPWAVHQRSAGSPDNTFWMSAMR